MHSEQVRNPPFCALRLLFASQETHINISTEQTGPEELPASDKPGFVSTLGHEWCGVRGGSLLEVVGSSCSSSCSSLPPRSSALSLRCTAGTVQTLASQISRGYFGVFACANPSSPARASPACVPA